MREKIGGLAVLTWAGLRGGVSVALADLDFGAYQIKLPASGAAASGRSVRTCVLSLGSGQASLDLVRISRLSCSPVSRDHRAILRTLGVK